MKFKKALTYDDILLVPQYSDIRSRKEVDIGNELDENTFFNFPVISAPMDTVTESAMAYSMSQAGGLGIIHRYNNINEMAATVRELHDSFLRSNTINPSIAVAIGVTAGFIKRAHAAWENGANIICIDVAHGHHVLVKEAIAKIKVEFGNKLHIMAGNIATLKGFNDLSDWGADSIRCNIGGGSICSTRIQTGHGIPGLQTIFECARSDRSATIIADGGIRSSGDAVKAFAAGADFVMLGSMLAGTDESPGDIIIGSKHTRSKVYRGMASKEAQFDWKGQHSSNEGISITIPYKGKVENILEDLKNGIISGLSYSGCRTIKELQSRSQFICQTDAGLNESKTHILRR